MPARRRSDCDDPRLLRRGLRVVGEVLETAAAAGREVLARRLDALRPGVDDLDRLGLGVAALHLRHARANRVARQPAPHEDDEAAEPCDAGTGRPALAVGERVDLELDLLPALHRCRHAAEATGRGACGAARGPSRSALSMPVG